MKEYVAYNYNLVDIRCKKLFPRRAVFIRSPRRVYTIMDFADGEVVEFVGFAANPSQGFGLYRSMDGLQTNVVNIKELRAIG